MQLSNPELIRLQDRGAQMMPSGSCFSLFPHLLFPHLLASSVLTPLTDRLILHGYKVICSCCQDSILPGSVTAAKNESPWPCIPRQALRLNLGDGLTSKPGKLGALTVLGLDCLFFPYSGCWSSIQTTWPENGGKDESSDKIWAILKKWANRWWMARIDKISTT